jgi:surface protein
MTTALAKTFKGIRKIYKYSTENKGNLTNLQVCRNILVAASKLIMNFATLGNANHLKDAKYSIQRELKLIYCDGKHEAECTSVSQSKSAIKQEFRSTTASKINPFGIIYNNHKLLAMLYVTAMSAYHKHSDANGEFHNSDPRRTYIEKIAFWNINFMMRTFFVKNTKLDVLHEKVNLPAEDERKADEILDGPEDDRTNAEINDLQKKFTQNPEGMLEQTAPEHDKEPVVGGGMWDSVKRALRRTPISPDEISKQTADAEKDHKLLMYLTHQNQENTLSLEEIKYLRAVFNHHYSTTNTRNADNMVRGGNTIAMLIAVAFVVGIVLVGIGGACGSAPLTNPECAGVTIAGIVLICWIPAIYMAGGTIVVTIGAPIVAYQEINKEHNRRTIQQQNTEQQNTEQQNTLQISTNTAPTTKEDLQDLINAGYDVTNLDVSAITDMSDLFKDAPNFNQDISKWNVSNVTNMARMFQNCKIFNQPIGNWERHDDPNNTSTVSKVTNMEYMFKCRDSLFNQDISKWNVSNVTNMAGMFMFCEKFNQPIGNWERHDDPNNTSTVSNVTNMKDMFSYCSEFNGDISKWNVSNVTNMEHMFTTCQNFNQPLEGWERWGSTVSNVTNMQTMFTNCKKFNRPIGNWNVSKVTKMSQMFERCSEFNQPLAGWERWGSTVSNVTDMNNMFAICNKFNQPIGNWNVSNVTNMSGMFCYCRSFDQPIGNWNVSNVTKMSDMFRECDVFNQPLAGWERWGSTVSNVTNMSEMFESCKKFNRPIGNWNVSKVTNMSEMFENCSEFNQPLAGWERLGSTVSNVTRMEEMFKNASKFNQDIGNWNVSSVTHMYSMFYNASKFNQTLENWDVSNVNYMYYMFSREHKEPPKWYNKRLSY